MDWEAFQHTHYRPHLLIVSVEAKRKPNPSVAMADLERLAVRLGTSGNYAFRMDGTYIYAAFEDDADGAIRGSIAAPTNNTRSRMGIQGLGTHGPAHLPEDRDPA